MQYLSIEKTEDRAQLSSGVIKLSFCGDLILLKDMISEGVDATTGIRNYDFVFSAAKGYWADSDLVIGVMEGPFAGREEGFSNTNLYDLKEGQKIKLNFPDEFAQSIRKAGVGMVTTATNHLLDCGVMGAYRTLDVLSAVGIKQAGCYRNDKEYNSATIVNVNGRKIAFIAYTAWQNYLDRSWFFEKGHCVEKCLAPEGRPYFDECCRQVKRDFEAARLAGAETIVVMPHMGMEFRHQPDPVQLYWCRFFVECGADIVFSAHPHTVQPVEWVAKPGGGNALIVYCPGNFITSYADKDVDAGMLVDVYLDSVPEVGACCVDVMPICSCRTRHGKYIALPVYDGLNRPEFANMLDDAATTRLKEVSKIVLDAAFGVRVLDEDVRHRYRVFAGNQNVIGI